MKEQNTVLSTVVVWVKFRTIIKLDLLKLFILFAATPYTHFNSISGQQKTM